MSPTIIFIVGVVIFAVTVYGAVMAGGLTLTRRQLEENDLLDVRDDDERTSSTQLLDLKY